MLECINHMAKIYVAAKLVEQLRMNFAKYFKNVKMKFLSFFFLHILEKMHTQLKEFPRIKKRAFMYLTNLRYLVKKRLKVALLFVLEQI